MTGRVELRGLSARSAHGFLAALGVVEALYREGLNPRLAWTTDFSPRAVICGANSLDDIVTAVLRDRDRRLAGFVLNYPAGDPFSTLGCSAEELTAWAALAADLPNDHADLDLWSALVVEGGYTAAGKSKPTHFDFTSGRKQLLKIVRDIGSALDEGLLIEAMLGPWRYASELSTLGFEAEGERLQAIRGVPPTNDPVKGIPGADWLAFLGLSFYPLATRPGRDRDRVVTPACDADWNKSAFRWLTWTEPLSRPVIAALVTDPQIVGEDESTRQCDPASLTARGLTGVWQSSIVRFGQGLGAFGPPKSIARAKRASLPRYLAPA